MIKKAWKCYIYFSAWFLMLSIWSPVFWYISEAKEVYWLSDRHFAGVFFKVLIALQCFASTMLLIFQEKLFPKDER